MPPLPSRPTTLLLLARHGGKPTADQVLRRRLRTKSRAAAALAEEETAGRHHSRTNVYRVAGLCAAGVLAVTAAAAATTPAATATATSPPQTRTAHPPAIEDEYEIMSEIIGEGGYCVVHKGRDRRTGELVAIKMLSKTETSAREFWSEVDVLRVAGQHPNVMELRGTFETDDCWYIVQGLAQDGELFDHLISKGAYSEKQASSAMRELCDALHYLHRKGIVHGDIKPENILLHRDRMCLVDFGVSFRLGERFFGDTQLTGTVAYAAPETLQNSATSYSYENEVVDEDDDGPSLYKLGPKADMFALGVVLYILLCGAHPFDPYNNLTDEEIRQRILKGKFRRQSRAWQAISPLARDLIEKLLETDPQKRLSSKEALQHPWLLRNAKLSRVPLRDSADLLEKFQRGRRRLRASILGVLLVDALEDEHGGEHDSDKPPEKIKNDFAWGLSSSIEALNEKTDALLSTIHIFDKEWKGFITKNDLARVSEKLGTRMSENDLNEMLVGSTGDPEQKPSAVKSISYDNVKMTISTLRSATYAPGEAIIREGNAAGHNVYLLLDGNVEVSCKNPLADSTESNSSAYDEAEAFAEMFSPPEWPKTMGSSPKPSPTDSDEIVLKRLQKGSFFGEIELVRPDGRFHPRIATYRCAEGATSSPGKTSCKVLQLVANDFLNISNTYSSINRRLENSALHHTQERLIKCVEAAKGSIKKRSFEPGDFIYKEGEVCDSFFILLDGQVEVLKQNGQVVVEELHPGAYFPLGVSGETQDFKIITRHSSVRCTQPTVVVEIGGETFRSFLHSNQFFVSYFRQQVKTREQQRLEKLSGTT